MPERDNRYTEKDLHNVVTYETGLQILYGIRKLRETEPISARTQPEVEEITDEETDEIRQQVLWEDFDDGGDIWEDREWKDLDT